MFTDKIQACTIQLQLSFSFVMIIYLVINSDFFQFLLERQFFLKDFNIARFSFIETDFIVTKYLTFTYYYPEVIMEKGNLTFVIKFFRYSWYDDLGPQQGWANFLVQEPLIKKFNFMGSHIEIFLLLACNCYELGPGVTQAQ